MTRIALSLDSGIRGKPVYLLESRRPFGRVDDVIIHPKYGVIAFVSQDSRNGAWAFAYTNTRIVNDGIIVVENEKQSPRRFLSDGHSYQDMLGAKVLGPGAALLGRIKDIELINVQTGDVAYVVSRPGLRGLWSPAFSVDAVTQVVDHTFDAIILGAESPTPGFTVGPEAAVRHSIPG